MSLTGGDGGLICCLHRTPPADRLGSMLEASTFEVPLARAVLLLSVVVFVAFVVDIGEDVSAGAGAGYIIFRTYGNIR